MSKKVKKPRPTSQQWDKCIKYARPNQVHEFRWLISVGRDDIAYCVDTSKVVGLGEGKHDAERTEHFDDYCQSLLKEEKEEQ